MDNEITINGEIYIKESYIPERTLKKLGKIEEKPWPQEGDEFWFIGNTGKANSIIYNPKAEWNEALIKFGNFFQTKEEAQMYSLRIESLKGIGKPIKDYWYWNFDFGGPLQVYSEDNVFAPHKFPTKEECQEWYDQFGHAWTFLLDNNKK